MKITYNDGTDCLNFTSNKNTILIYFGLVKLFINEEVLPFTIFQRHDSTFRKHCFVTDIVTF